MVDVERSLYEILKEIAREHGFYDSDINLEKMETGGANFCSTLFTTFLSAPLGKKDLKLFCKVASIGENLRNCFKGSSHFETEIMFYTKILPKYREIEEIHKVPNEDRLITPEFYGGCSEYMREFLVLEHMSSSGYECMERFDCFDWQYASKCVSVLARLHALSVAFKRDDSVTYSNLVDALTFEYPASQDSLEKGIQTAVKATDAKYRLRVEKFLLNNLREQSLRKYMLQGRRFLLHHGDFRPSNILHKIDKDGNLRVLLTDFQITRRGNPVADLLLFLVCGSDEQFRAVHLHQLFDHYYASLSAALRQLSIDPREVYSEKDYREDIEKILPYGLILAIFFLPFITVEKDDAPKPDDCVNFETFEFRLGDRFRDRFNGLVNTYVELGIL